MSTANWVIVVVIAVSAALAAAAAWGVRQPGGQPGWLVFMDDHTVAGLIVLAALIVVFTVWTRRWGLLFVACGPLLLVGLPRVLQERRGDRGSTGSTSPQVVP
jgi:hypothetical protein